MQVFVTESKEDSGLTHIVKLCDSLQEMGVCLLWFVYWLNGRIDGDVKQEGT